MRGADHITGGNGADSLNGAGGADVTFGAGGNDTLDTSHFHTGGVQTATEVVLYDALTGPGCLMTPTPRAQAWPANWRF